jgi:hypothetical protein
MTHVPLVDALYPRLAGAPWASLDPAVRRCFLSNGASVRATGLFSVRRGTSRLARWVATAAGLPPAGDAVHVELTIDRRGPVELWRRSFGAHRSATIQLERPGALLAERKGPVELRYRILVGERELRLEPAGAFLTLGPIAIPLPARLAPRASATLVPSPEPGWAEVSVRIELPAVGLLLAYGGRVRAR